MGSVRDTENAVFSLARARLGSWQETCERIAHDGHTHGCLDARPRGVGPSGGRPGGRMTMGTMSTMSRDVMFADRREAGRKLAAETSVLAPPV